MSQLRVLEYKNVKLKFLPDIKVFISVAGDRYT